MLLKNVKFARRYPSLVHQCVDMIFYSTW